MRIVMLIVALVVFCAPFLAIANIPGLNLWLRVVLTVIGTAPGIALLMFVFRRYWHNTPS
jgi:hypothetical protein